MFIDREKNLITFPLPLIEPASDELREAMDSVLGDPDSFETSIFHETVEKYPLLTNFRGTEWHTDAFDAKEYKLELAATSTPTTVASAVIDFSKLEKSNVIIFLDKPAEYLKHSVSERWVEDAEAVGELVAKNGLIVRDVKTLQIEPYQVASGDAATLLHRSSEIKPNEPRVRALYRRFYVHIF